MCWVKVNEKLGFLLPFNNGTNNPLVWDKQTMELAQKNLPNTEVNVRFPDGQIHRTMIKKVEFQCERKNV